MVDELQTRFAEFEKTLRKVESAERLIEEAMHPRPRTPREAAEFTLKCNLEEVKSLIAERQALVTETFRLETIGLSCEREKRRIKGVDRRVARLRERSRESREYASRLSAGANEGSTRKSDEDAKAIASEARIQRKLSAYKAVYVLMIVAANVVFFWLLIKLFLWISK